MTYPSLLPSQWLSALHKTRTHKHTLRSRAAELGPARAVSHVFKFPSKPTQFALWLLWKEEKKTLTSAHTVIKQMEN